MLASDSIHYHMLDMLAYGPICERMLAHASNSICEHVLAVPGIHLLG